MSDDSCTLKTKNNPIPDYKTSTSGRSTASKYADIIDMPRPELHHQRMDILNRAKLFAPFDALRGFDEEIEEVDKKKSVDTSEVYTDEDFSI
ncbi:MAG: hypothetical protein PUF16_05110 [Lachnospiraceae bacterium]|nr:hypothetical protein [Lachnospiraceae bacterium]